MRHLLVPTLAILFVSCTPPAVEPTLAPTLRPIASPEPAATKPLPSATPTSEEGESDGDDQVVLPEEPVIVFRQEGGFAGVERTWTIFADGHVESEEGAIWQVSPEIVAALLEAIEQSGFFDLRPPEPANVCCDFFTYTLMAYQGDLGNSITISEAHPEMPQGLSEAIKAVQEFIRTATPG